MNDKLWKVLVIVAVALSAVAVLVTVIVPEEAVPRAYQCDVYTEQGCAKYVVASGGVIEIQSGGKLDVQSGAETDLSGGMDLDGALLDLDADGNTSIQADTDDQIDIEIGGADDFQFTANTFTALAGSTISLPATSDIAAYGYVAVGDGTPDGSVAAGTDEALYVEGDFEVDGEAEFDGAVDADGGMTIDGGVTNIGGGTPDVASGDNDLYVTGDLEVDAELQLDGTVDVNAVMTGEDDLEHTFFPTVASTAFTYTAAAGGTVVLWTVTAGEIWIVHDIYCNVTTNFDCTGEDCKVDIGDDTDPDGLCDLDDAELQAADTEMTGAPAGWQGMSSSDTVGAFFGSGRGFIYTPSGSDQTIDAVIDEDSGDTMTAGAATCYIVYTRIQ